MSKLPIRSKNPELLPKDSTAGDRAKDITLLDDDHTPGKKRPAEVAFTLNVLQSRISVLDITNPLWPAFWKNKLGPGKFKQLLRDFRNDGTLPDSLLPLLTAPKRKALPAPKKKKKKKKS